MVSKLIEKMINDGDPSAEDAETIIQNVAMVTVEGAIHRLYLLFMFHCFRISLAASDTVRS